MKVADSLLWGDWIKTTIILSQKYGVARPGRELDTSKVQVLCVLLFTLIFCCNSAWQLKTLI